MPGWEDELERWLMPFLDRLGHKTRQRMCPLYVAGLIGPGDRKSVQPMAERLATGNYDQLPPSLRTVSGTRHRWRQSCSTRPTDLSAAGMRCWLLMTPHCRRRVGARSALQLNTRRLSVKRQIAKRWCL
jgi:hypothetical protein